MTQLIIPIGIPGAGKSTLTKRLFPSHLVVSSDSIRQRIMGDTYDGSRNAEVWAEWDGEIEECLAQGLHVIADATNLPYRHRAMMRSLGEQYSADTHAFMFTNITQAVMRNMARTGVKQGGQRVPDGAMMNFVSLYERALHNIKNESYTTLTYVEKTV